MSVSNDDCHLGNVVPIRPSVRPAEYSRKPIARGAILIAGDGVRAEDIFTRVSCDAKIARAEHALIDARRWKAYLMEGPEAAKAFDDDSEAAFSTVRRMAAELAMTPAMNRHQLRVKISGIGSIWLKAKGRFYDGLRWGVAQDELRLGVKRPRFAQVPNGVASGPCPTGGNARQTAI